MKLLIVKLSAFGDIIHALPALEDLRARPERPEIHWLVDARYAFVTEAFPPDVRVHVVALKQGDWRGVARTLRSLRRLRFDAVLDLQGLVKSALLARLAGGSVFGLDARHLREPVARWLQHPVPFHAEDRHVVQQLRRVAAAPFAGTRPPEHPMPFAPPAIAPTEAMRRSGDKTLTAWELPTPFAWLHLGGGWATKQLPDATWLTLIQGLLDRGIAPLLGWGAETERKRAQYLASQAPGAIAARERLPMRALCGLLARASVVVGADTGVLHLAAALGAPTVSFWGPSASWRSAPHGERDRHVESNPACGPCFKRSCDRFVCMDMIRAGDILAAIDDVRS